MLVEDGSETFVRPSWLIVFVWDPVPSTVKLYEPERTPLPA